MRTLGKHSVLAVLAFAVPVLLVVLFGLHTLTSVYQDIGRHITLGRIIWESHRIPSTNLFSYTTPDFPFINHHWFGEVVLFMGDRLAGLQGLIIAKALLLATAFGLAFAAAWRRRIAVPAMAIGLISILIYIERTDVRPEILSFLFLGWFLWVLYRKSHAPFFLATLPLVQVIWVNTHIYFFMGPFVVLAFVVHRLVLESGNWSERWPELRRLLFLSGSIALAVLINPHGLSGALYPLNVWGNYGYSIAENKSPFFLRAFGFSQLTFYALGIGIAVAGIVSLANWRRWRQNLMGLLLLMGTAVLALVMTRNFPLFALCMLPATLKQIDELGWFRNLRTPVVVAWLLLLSLFGVSVATNQVYTQARLGRRFGIEVPQGPQEPVAFFRAAGMHGPIFNNFDVGSFLIWQLPEEPVFIDGRPEAYPADFIQNVYIAMQEHQEVWEYFSREYALNAIFWNEQDITPWSRTFVPRILQDPDWVLVYRAHGIMMLVRNVPENAAIIRAYAL